ncbi:hypothetical protein B0T26DRAFT_694098 [Lasiosphaeria miniovina]|uniref:Uncharacterized protein n=1 Tax=Lasiosphaeria miniovina TaxID=1954250 RepID=A0AA40B4B3_9PEZI|nr:uncharacterized protein B0T26DRAFT_694098 [Lasiosphaeria miniovina]KAK0727329.1 hypothetical protein B0T26DRAFT_694098 [Lasiosphaeria miniovina]
MFVHIIIVPGMVCPSRRVLCWGFAFILWCLLGRLIIRSVSSCHSTISALTPHNLSRNCWCSRQYGISVYIFIRELRYTYIYKCFLVV